MTPEQQLQKVIDLQSMAALLFKNSSELRTVLERVANPKVKKQIVSDETFAKFRAKRMKTNLLRKSITV